MDRVMLRHKAAVAFTDRWFNQQARPNLRALDGLPCYVALEDDPISEVVANISKLHPEGSNALVASETREGEVRAVVQMLPRQNGTNASDSDPIPVDPSITMGTFLALLDQHRDVLFTAKQFSCYPKTPKFSLY